MGEVLGFEPHCVSRVKYNGTQVSKTHLSAAYTWREGYPQAYKACTVVLVFWSTAKCRDRCVSQPPRTRTRLRSARGGSSGAPRARVSGFPFPVGRPPPGYTVSLTGVGLTTGCFVKGAVRSRSSLIHSGTIPARLAFAVNVPRTDEAQNARRSETSVTLSMLSSLIGTQDADGHAAAHGCTLLVVSLPSTSVSLVRLVDQRPSRRRRGTAYTTRW